MSWYTCAETCVDIHVLIRMCHVSFHVLIHVLLHVLTQVIIHVVIHVNIHVFIHVLQRRLVRCVLSAFVGVCLRWAILLDHIVAFDTNNCIHTENWFPSILLFTYLCAHAARIVKKLNFLAKYTYHCERTPAHAPCICQFEHFIRQCRMLSSLTY